MNYFNLYKVVLEVCDNPNVTDGQKLLDEMIDHPYISKLRTKHDDTVIILKIMNVLENCIDEGAIKGEYGATMDEHFHRIRDLTTFGHQCLETLSNNSSFSKFKKFAKDSASKITVDSLGYLFRNYLQ
ncbi:hypothetical protein [Staphylococcus aureus]|uniref:hypothetical protein n=1 Tax=Staphylococcus aureus TaxID=1280 RepID=UPI0004534DA6|nr:hypothetical protein [Staphylococcus aureus]EZY57205.1 hypothetical protein V060_02822 [Staphylococcus aureus R0294]EZY66760.1 hypothetical protein V063_02761 [Staphylococcus aureus R0487]